MSDRINQIEEQAKVILEWCRQRKGLPEEQWDILECREIGDSNWELVLCYPGWNLNTRRFRLRKRFKKHTATVYWYRYSNGAVSSRLSPISDFLTNTNTKFLGTSTVEFTEPQE